MTPRHPAQAPITTLTMNPALDVSTSVDRVVAEHKLRCAPSSEQVGGGGVNVSRAIHALGGRSHAIYPLGGPVGRRYRSAAARAGLRAEVVSVADDTRESFTVTETSTGAEYRFVLPGPTLTAPEWRACLDAVAGRAPQGGYLVASGSLPPGVPPDFYAVLAREMSGRGVRVVVDASGPPLASALAEGVFLIKPSRDELAELVGVEGELGPREQGEAARSILRSGGAEVVALTLGAGGALLVSRDAELRLPTPNVPVVSTVGAGDSFLGALVLGLARGRPLARAFRTAVAAGSATTMRAPSELCRAEDVARLERELDAANASTSPAPPDSMTG